MNKEKRYTATYTMYIYAKDDNHARSKAKMIETRENIKYPAQDCRLEQLDETPFASLATREVSLAEPIKNQEELPF
tara:strand:- start:1033 stop:1260 length:228 start_codon:yes stop_codon:yes gene_type:complete